MITVLNVSATRYPGITNHVVHDVVLTDGKHSVLVKYVMGWFTQEWPQENLRLMFNRCLRTPEVEQKEDTEDFLVF